MSLLKLTNELVFSSVSGMTSNETISPENSVAVRQTPSIETLAPICNPSVDGTRNLKVVISFPLSMETTHL